MTMHTTTAEQAMRTLRGAGYTVTTHGLNYLLGATSADR